MTVKAFRVENFMAFEDTDWIELTPICLLFGRNSSGKSAIIRALRFLKQSLRSHDGSLIFTDEYGVDLGYYRRAIHQQDLERNLAFSFRCSLEDTLDPLYEQVNLMRFGLDLPPVPAREFPNWVEIRMEYVSRDEGFKTWLSAFTISAPWGENTVHEKMTIAFDAYYSPERVQSGGEEWIFVSDLFSGHETDDDSAWLGINVEPLMGFLPALIVPPTRIFQESKSLQDLKLMQALLKELREDIASFLESIEYLGPIRPAPRRVYALDPTEQEHWRRQGWGAFLRLISGDIDELSRDQINEWMRDLKLGTLAQSFTSGRPSGDWAVVGDIEIDESEFLTVNLVDIGYGAAQVLPVIVESVLAQRDVLVIIEQPELHLHPSAQAELADLFIEAATRVRRFKDQKEAERNERLGKGERDPGLLTEEELRARRAKFLIETHSEHLLLRFQRRIMETLYERKLELSGAPKSSRDSISSDQGYPLDRKELLICFVVRSDGKSQIEFVRTDQTADFVSEDASESVPPSQLFLDFFEQDYVEVKEFSRIKAKLLRLENDELRDD